MDSAKLMVRKICFGLVLGGIFILPFFGWLAAEPTPYRDPGGRYSFFPPEGWLTDDSGYMGAGVVAKGPAGPAGLEPSIHLLHEPAGIVTLEVQWHTLLGRLRYDLARVKYLAIEDFEEKQPPYHQAHYSYRVGERSHQALVRLLLHEGRFYQLTATAPEEEFEALRPRFLAAFDSLKVKAAK